MYIFEIYVPGKYVILFSLVLRSPSRRIFFEQNKKFLTPPLLLEISFEKSLKKNYIVTFKKNLTEMCKQCFIFQRRR